ncbi:MAG TPA: PLP-dependent aminotransferase family protein, partial [Bacteroidia bacterium]|nr:PLP-dependent aminotransferase family protein [Bacteroidia bacterium]
MKPKKELLYLQIAKSIEEQIHNELLKVGDKLPSIRMVCREQGVSMSTAQLAYSELQSKSLIESRPQSGYYVSQSHKQHLELPEASKPKMFFSNKNPENLVAKVFNTINDKSITRLSLGIPPTEFLPVAKLSKAVLQAMRELIGNGTAYEKIEGNMKLRRQIARWSFNWNSKLSEHDIITTAGCANAISYCMMALAKRGDVIAVESPMYFGILQLAQSLGLKVLELPTHPKTGIEIDALKKVLVTKRVKLVLLISNFNNPLGSCMPDEHKKEVVRLIGKYGVPLIEDDLFGDIYFSKSRPKSCKTYDE